MNLKPGSRWQSTRCATQIVVVRAPAGDVALECGGAPMQPVEAGGEPAAAPSPPFDQGTQLGKRYRDEELGLEVLCSRGGAGTLAVDGRVIPLAEAKPLPASD